MGVGELGHLDLPDALVDGVDTDGEGGLATEVSTHGLSRFPRRGMSTMVRREMRFLTHCRARSDCPNEVESL